MSMCRKGRDVTTLRGNVQVNKTLAWWKKTLAYFFFTITIIFSFLVLKINSSYLLLIRINILKFISLEYSNCVFSFYIFYQEPHRQKFIAFITVFILDIYKKNILFYKTTIFLSSYFWVMNLNFRRFGFYNF